MGKLSRTTLEQWAVLRAVIEAGSYVQAATQLNRSQSSVSYAISRLQESLGLDLLEMDGRRAVLSQAGHALLAEASPLIDDWMSMENRATAIAGGENPRVRLLVDSLYPRERLLNALEELTRQHPTVEVDLTETIRAPVPDPKQTPFDLAVTLHTPDYRQSIRLMELRLVAVAHREHPLAQRSGPITQATLARHVRIHFQDRGVDEPVEPLGKVWRVSTIEAALAAVRQKLCFGWLPEEYIATDLESGRLVRLPIAAGAIRTILLDLCFGDSDRASPAVLLLAKLLTKDQVDLSK